MARLFATSSALALLALPLPTNAQGLVITTPQAGVTVTAGTTYLQIIGTTITGNVTVPQGVVLAPGPGNGLGSALAVSNSTINGAILNAGTVSVSLPKGVYVQNAISVSNGSPFSNAGGSHQHRSPECERKRYQHFPYERRQGNLSGSGWDSRRHLERRHDHRHRLDHDRRKIRFRFCFWHPRRG
jgi:hypothetical protein